MEAYQRLRTVGRGATGVVQLCQRKKDGEMVIIKEVPVEEMSLDERQVPPAAPPPNPPARRLPRGAGGAERGQGA